MDAYKNDTPKLVYITFYTGIFLLTIGAWWWLLPVDHLPKQSPWCIGMLVSFLFFLSNEKNKETNTSAWIFGRLFSLGILTIYLMGFLLSFTFK